MEFWCYLYSFVIFLLTAQYAVEGRNAAYRGKHPKRSQASEESSSDSVLDIYKTAKQLEDLHETLQDVIKVLEIIGEKEKAILESGEDNEQSKPTPIHLSLLHPDEEKTTPTESDTDTSVLGLELARLLSQKENKDKIIDTPPEPIPAKKSTIIDPQPRRADPGEDDEDKMFKRILAKYMKRQLEKDGLQVM